MRHIKKIVLICIMVLVLPQLALASKTHLVRKNESLHSIARKYHVSVDKLKSVNGLTSTRIKVGARIIIPTNAKAKSVKVSEKSRTYKVVKGDTLPGIARKTGVRMSDLRRLNKIKGNKIKQGQLLTLRKYTTPSEPRRGRETSENRLALINPELLNERELNDTLAELTDMDVDQPIDLAKNLEEKNQKANSIKKTAYSFLGARYRFGGNSRNSLDCSSFTQQVFRDHNIRLPRTAREQFRVGTEVMRGDLRKGDLVFFQTYARFPSHVGIYLGNRKMIHASSRDRRVIISSMDTPYYLGRYLGARRVSENSFESFNDLLLGVIEEKPEDVLANDALGLSSELTN
ncbi:MAG TPA: NlpC/P60 family protein [Deltaproteobacteria bacterium]|nr:NlpC/P60 family protein [Deltaproteobacteria bacterium]HQB39882.1 NlpC/P60 family protein [Deltaproteobacteria bacterium]